MMPGRPRTIARAALWASCALAVAGCTGPEKKSFEPLPATSGVVTADTVPAPSLPDGCGGIGEMITEQYPIRSAAPTGGGSDEDTTSTSIDDGGEGDGGDGGGELAGGDEPTLPGAPDDDTVESTVVGDDGEAIEVDPNEVSIDVFTLPAECGTRPVVFWVHGGDWSEGDKRDLVLNATVAARYGWVLVAVNHRLAGEASGVMWPSMGEDVASAVAHTLERADAFGIDPTKVAVVGHDSGAHLTAMLTTEPQMLAVAGASRDDIDCAVLLDPLTLSIPLLIDEAPDDIVEMVERVFGTDFTTYQRASPAIVLTQVEGRVANTFIVTQGGLDRQAQAYDYAELVRGTGATAEVIVTTAYGDDEVSDLWEVGDDSTNQTVLAALDNCLDAADA